MTPVKPTSNCQNVDQLLTNISGANGAAINATIKIIRCSHMLVRTFIFGNYFHSTANCKLLHNKVVNYVKIRNYITSKRINISPINRVTIICPRLF